MVPFYDIAINGKVTKRRNLYCLKVGYSSQLQQF